LEELDLKDNRLNADDGARICGAAAVAGMTRLKMLDLQENNFFAPDIVSSEAWRELNLPQPPDEILRRNRSLHNIVPLLLYLLSQDKVACHTIRMFVVGESLVRACF
jgi:hypothetical protein